MDAHAGVEYVTGGIILWSQVIWPAFKHWILQDEYKMHKHQEIDIDEPLTVRGITYPGNGKRQAAA